MRVSKGFRTFQVAITPVVVAASIMLTGSVPASAGAACEAGGALCDATVSSDVLEPKLGKAIDLVFVSEGYGLGDMEEFREDAWDLVDSLAVTTRFLSAREPTLFNVHLVEVPMVGGSVNDDARLDTPLGAGLGPPEGSLGRRRIVMDGEVMDAAAALAPDVDVVTVIVRGSDGRANADRPQGSRTWGRVRISSHDVAPDLGIWVHELGHAIFGLGDEYGGFGGCATDSGLDEKVLASYPNLTTDPSGKKWAHIHDGAHEGGRGFSACIYHPTGSCKMQRYDDEFCSVCQNAIAASLERRKCEGDGSCALAEAPPSAAFGDEGSPSGCGAADPGVPLSGLLSAGLFALAAGLLRRRRT